MLSAGLTATSEPAARKPNIILIITDQQRYDTIRALGFPYMDTPNLDRLVEEGRLKPTRQVADTVTYHDPCYLGRHNHIYEAPRRLLQSIPGLTLIEMAGNRENSLCCGGGGAGAWSNVPPQRRTGVLRIEEALSTGAEVIATACPYCIRMLSEAVRQLGVQDQIVVRDLAELLLQSVMIKDEALMTEGVDQEVCHV